MNDAEIDKIIQHQAMNDARARCKGCVHTRCDKPLPGYPCNECTRNPQAETLDHYIANDPAEIEAGRQSVPREQRGGS